MTQALVVQDVMTVGKVFAESGFFSDSKQAAQAVVKIMAGQELGFPPVVAMTGINIVQGKVSIGAGLMGALVKKSGRYDYRIKRLDDKGCTVVFYDKGQAVYESTFTEDDAKRASLLGKDNWNKHPKNMYFARAISNGARFVCPDVVTGVYTPDELELPVDSDGNAVIDAIVTPVVETPQPTQPAPAPQNGDTPFVDFIADPRALRGFWAFAKDLGLTHDDVLAALNVQHLHEVTGSKAQVKATLTAFSQATTKPAPAATLTASEEPLFEDEAA